VIGDEASDAASEAGSEANAQLDLLEQEGESDVQDAISNVIAQGLSVAYADLEKIGEGIAEGTAAGTGAVAATSATLVAVLGTSAAVGACFFGIGAAVGAAIGGISAILKLGLFGPPAPPPNLDDPGWDTLGRLYGKFIQGATDRPESDYKFTTPTSTPISPLQATAVLRAVNAIGVYCLAQVIPNPQANLYGNDLVNSIGEPQGAAAVFIWQSCWPSLWNMLANGTFSDGSAPGPNTIYTAILGATGFQKINSRLFANSLARAMGAPENGAPFVQPPTPSIGGAVAAPAPIAPVFDAAGAQSAIANWDAQLSANGGGWGSLASLEATLTQSFAQMYGPGLAAAAAAKAKQTPVSLPPKPAKAPWSTTKKVAVSGAAVAAAGAAGVAGAHLAGVNVLGFLAGLLRRR
jgi:hypothetical protein